MPWPRLACEWFFCLEILTQHYEGFILPNMSGFILEIGEKCIFIKQRGRSFVWKRDFKVLLPYLGVIFCNNSNYNYDRLVGLFEHEFIIVFFLFYASKRFCM